MTERGKFISLEGGEGCGKSTQTTRLAETLRARGYEVVQTREVGGCAGAEAIRALWLHQPEGGWTAETELLLINAARREHIARVIAPALARGAWVVCDRFVDSTRAYQGIGLNLGLDTVNALHTLMQGGIEPDLTLILDVPVDIGLARMRARGGEDDRYQQRDTGFHETLRQAYLTLAAANPARIRVIDATGTMDDVSAAIGAHI
jgi:dTMP kinase